MLLELFKRLKTRHNGQDNPQTDGVSATNHPRPGSQKHNSNYPAEEGPVKPQHAAETSYGPPDRLPGVDPLLELDERRRNLRDPPSDTNPHHIAAKSDTTVESPVGNNTNLFRNARHFAVNHSNIVYGSSNIVGYFDSGKAALDHLLPYVCAGAAVDSSERDPPPSCHPGTREDIQHALATWLDDPEPQRNMFWLTGPAGTGKSAVAQTFAELCLAKGRLGAAFFFSRPNERDKPQTVIPTIAYQLAINFPDYRLLLTDRIAYDPTILQKTPRAQLVRLIIEPFSTLQVKGHPVVQRPFLVLLDGLDECEGIPAQCEFVEMVGEVVRLKKGLPILWLICSRPEPHLKRIFSRSDYSIDCIKEELLIDAKTKDDVELYLRDSFAKLRVDFHDRVNSLWPSKSQFDKILKITSGLFVLASTIIKYLSDPNHANPMARLVDLLEFMRNTHRVGVINPLEALDLFYFNILSDIPDNTFLMTKRILSHHIALRSSQHGIFPAQTLCNLLNIDRSQFYAALQKLHSVLDVPPHEDIRGDHLKFYHASFEDYLSNPLRSGKFAIDLVGAQAEITTSCPYTYKILNKIRLDATASPVVTSEDIMHLLQTRILRSQIHYQTLLQANGASAQRLIDILHKLLTSHLVDDATRRSTLITYLRLSATSGLLPRLLMVNITAKLSEPLRVSEISDIYKLRHRGRPFLLKTMRLFQVQGLDSWRKVSAHEALIWSQLVHPNILAFYGMWHLAGDQPRTGLLSPWMENGDLPQYLSTHPEALRLPIVHDVLAGVQYLHQNQVVHGDINGANILFKHDGTACLTDFGSSSVVDPDILSQISPANDVVRMARWCAPELFEDFEDAAIHRGFSNDVYSAASTMIEVFTSKVPFFEFHYDFKIIKKKLHGDTPEKPNRELAPELTDTIWEIMMDCWKWDPNDRPVIDEVIDRLPRNDLSLPGQRAQSNFWRPTAIWTPAERNEDKMFPCCVFVRLKTRKGGLQL